MAHADNRSFRVILVSRNQNILVAITRTTWSCDFDSFSVTLLNNISDFHPKSISVAKNWSHQCTYYMYLLFVLALFQLLWHYRLVQGSFQSSGLALLLLKLYHIVYTGFFHVQPGCHCFSSHHQFSKLSDGNLISIKNLSIKAASLSSIPLPYHMQFSSKERLASMDRFTSVGRLVPSGISITCWLTFSLKGANEMKVLLVLVRRW